MCAPGDRYPPACSVLNSLPKFRLTEKNTGRMHNGRCGCMRPRCSSPWTEVREDQVYSQFRAISPKYQRLF